MRKKRSDTDWKSPKYWQYVTALVRTWADELWEVRKRYLAPAAKRATHGRGGCFVYVPRYRSLRQLCDSLNGHGLRTRTGKTFGPETVRLLLARTEPNPEPLPTWCEEQNQEVIGWLMDNDLVTNAEAITAKWNGPKADYRNGKYDLNPKGKVGRAYKTSPKGETTFAKRDLLHNSYLEDDVLEGELAPVYPGLPWDNTKDRERLKLLRERQAEQQQFHYEKQQRED